MDERTKGKWGTNLIDISKLKVGDKVHYQPSYYAETVWENGMIKEIPVFATDKAAPIGYNCVRVVYNCGGDWENFKNYTSALTNLRDLKLGWLHQVGERIVMCRPILSLSDLRRIVLGE